MMIPIPVGTTHAFTARGEVWRFVTCGHCKEPFAYRIDLEATGKHTDLLFLDSAFSLRLLRAYSKIKDQTVQRQLVSLMESIAANED